MTNQQIHDWLLGFDLDDQLHVYVAEVVGALPNEPRDDLIGDPSFRVSDYDAGSGRTHQVPIGVPGRKRPVPDRSSSNAASGEGRLRLCVM